MLLPACLTGVWPRARSNSRWGATCALRAQILVASSKLFDIVPVRVALSHRIAVKPIELQQCAAV